MVKPTDELTDVLERVCEGNSNRINITRQEVVDVNYENEEGSRQIVSIFTGSKYAQFHDEFTQIAGEVDHLKPLLQYLDHEGYTTNLD